jgi:amidase
MLAAGEMTSLALVELYLERIARLDGQLIAYRMVRRDGARIDAVEAQRRLDAGGRRPLLGVPVAVKDDVDVAGEVTAWGTAAYGPTKERDAEVVRRLRDAGAIVIGKTNVPEMTIWPFTDSVTFGATRNPWDLSRSPGGSSRGDGSCGRGRPGLVRPGIRRWRLDPHSSGLVRPVWDQAAARPGAARTP